MYKTSLKYTHFFFRWTKVLFSFPPSNSRYEFPPFHSELHIILPNVWIPEKPRPVWHHQHDSISQVSIPAEYKRSSFASESAALIQRHTSLNGYCPAMCGCTRKLYFCRRFTEGMNRHCILLSAALVSQNFRLCLCSCFNDKKRCLRWWKGIYY